MCAQRCACVSALAWLLHLVVLQFEPAFNKRAAAITRWRLNIAEEEEEVRGEERRGEEGRGREATRSGAMEKEVVETGWVDERSRLSLAHTPSASLCCLLAACLQVSEIERRCFFGQIEELIEQAENELDLTVAMNGERRRVRARHTCGYEARYLSVPVSHASHLPVVCGRVLRGDQALDYERGGQG